MFIPMQKILPSLSQGFFIGQHARLRAHRANIQFAFYTKNGVAVPFFSAKNHFFAEIGKNVRKLRKIRKGAEFFRLHGNLFVVILFAKKCDTISVMTKANKTKQSEDRMDRMDRLERYLAESAAEFDKRWAKAQWEWAQLRKIVSANSAELNGYTKNASEAQEEEFAVAMGDAKRIGGIAVNKVYPDLRGAAFQYDATCVGDKAVIVAEVKHKIMLEDVKAFVKKQLRGFAKDFPGIAGKRKIYGAVAGGSIAKDAREEAQKHGLFVLGLRNRKLVVKSNKGVRAV